ncbi:protein kinase [Streptomyces albus subsp. chlorinus]|uniref:protein kinase domain-containing protein n=1 Tax=Streptomyces albus TaxID=1888 RepID=UPI0015700126|nr:protein kinase [Streptomyces albus]
MKPLEAGDPSAIGPYELLGRLGSGGMGEVFLGRSGEESLVAIKVARGEFADDAAFRRRFAREVQAARKVDGRFTAAVLGADPEGRRPWLATAYIPAASLADAVADGGPLPEASLRALLAGIAAALEAIHAAGLVHRDLKPANVLLADDGPRVIDFGISRSSDHSQITRTGQAPGTPGYMAPEQLRGSFVGPHTDVYALGATLVYAATGEGPFGYGDPLAMMYRALEEEPRLDAVPAGLRPVLARCLDKDPARRPTVAALRAEFTVPHTVREGRWLPPQIPTVVELPARLRPLRADDGPAGPSSPHPSPGPSPASPASSADPATPPSPSPSPATPHPQAPHAASPSPLGVYGPPPPPHGFPPSAVPPHQGRGLSRRAVLALAGAGVVVLGGGGVLTAVNLAQDEDGSGGGGQARGRGANSSRDSTDDSSSSRDSQDSGGSRDSQDSSGDGSGPLPAVVSGKRLGQKPTLERKRGAPPEKLVVRTLIQGSGTKARKTDHLKCHYVLEDWETAEEKDSSYARRQATLLQVGTGQVIKGWDQALIGKRAGSRLEFSVPPELAYGKEGSGDAIPPNATLLFVVDLLDVIHV